MQVKRIVANIKTSNPEKAHDFYHRLLGLELLMDHEWIRTYGNNTPAGAQISFASDGGSGTDAPDLSIEVDDLQEALCRVRAAGIPLEYGPVKEPWSVGRFYIRDPFGKLINILEHI